MSHDVTIDGVTYISSKRAAELTGYSQDYVGQLARAGKIIARRVGGLWYVVQDSVMGHKEVSESYVPTPPSPSEYNAAAEGASYVTFDGKTYISASRAAKMTSYHPDYIGQLARSGKVLSRQVGHRWYIDIEGLKGHKTEKDALLAAFQAESVGLARPIQDNSQNTAPVIAETEPFYTYTSEASPLLPLLQQDEEAPTPIPEPSGEALEEEALPKEHIIPIRVIHTQRVKTIEPPRAVSTPILDSQPVKTAWKSAFLRLAAAVFIIVAVVAGYNIQAFRVDNTRVQNGAVQNSSGKIFDVSKIGSYDLKRALEDIFTKRLFFERK